MSREIKFRAWDGKQMLTEENFDFVVSDYDSIIQLNEYGWTDHGVDCVEQYTGLKDKNGKEIYEGDIVSKNSLSGEYGALFVVKYGGRYDIDICGHHYCPFIQGFYLDEIYEYDGVDEEGYMEVIGNVHENPELLEDKNGRG